jgi:hypothetical protein
LISTFVVDLVFDLPSAPLLTSASGSPWGGGEVRNGADGSARRADAGRRGYEADFGAHSGRMPCRGPVRALCGRCAGFRGAHRALGQGLLACRLRRALAARIRQSVRRRRIHVTGCRGHRCLRYSPDGYSASEPMPPHRVTLYPPERFPQPRYLGSLRPTPETCARDR